MQTIRVTLTPRDDDAEPLQLETPDVITALAVADINVDNGTAEFYADGEKIARLTKHGGGHATFWKVD